MKRALLLIGLFVFATSGCFRATGFCLSVSDCPSGQICNLEDRCVDPPALCAADADCPEGRVCGASARCTEASAGLREIQVSPQRASIARENAIQLRASGLYTDGTTHDITSAAAWSTSNEQVAKVSASGLATAFDPGGARISASLGGLVGAADLTVTAAKLVEIAVTPVAPTLAPGNGLRFQATGTYSDGSTQDISAAARWASSDTKVAIISAGVARAQAPGSAVISANLGQPTGNTTLTVSAANLTAIEVTPQNPSAVKGTTVQLKVTGAYSDGSNQDLTAQAMWTSSSGAATVSGGGLASALGAGSATLTATFGGKSGSTVLTVTEATLLSIAVTPASPSAVLGASVQFAATGSYSDSSTQDLTGQATWSSSNSGSASVSNATGSKGRATALAIGTSMISAAFGGKSGATLLTVTASALCPGEPGNLLEDPSFEEGKAWIGGLRQTTHAHCGSYARWLSGKTVATSTAGPSAKTGETYQLTGWIFIHTVTPLARVRLFVMHDINTQPETDPVLFESSPLGGVTASWVKVKLDFTMTKNAGLTVGVRTLGTTGSVEFSVDDVSLVKM